MKQFLKGLFQSAGYDIISYPPFHDKQRLELFKGFDINTIIDIGANEGQYAGYMWNIGFEGTIISFEPVKATYDKLNLHSTNKGKWIKKNLALGDKDEEAVIHVTENTLSSSLLPQLEGLMETTPEAKVLREEVVRVVKLDSIFSELKENKPNFFLKIDSQGYEKKILEGASASLTHFKGIQIELSLKSLYAGEHTFFELFPHLLSLGFNLHEIEKGYCNPVTGEVLQVELILFRNR